MKKIVTSFLIALPAFLISFMFMSRGKMPVGWIDQTAFAATYLFFNIMFFMMVHTGKTDRYRSAIFVTTAFFFIISFISHMFESRGSMSFTDDTLLSCQIPFCHIVTTMIIIPFALTKTIIFPGSLTEGYAPIAGMIVIWLLASFSLGRGWCSWGCFFGGLDEGFSRILKKPVIKDIGPKWKYAPFVVLAVVAIASASVLHPVYCSWLCPFKAVTEYEALTSTEAVIKMIIFLSIFIGLVVVMPVLTKKRTQCAFFCPFGAMQSMTNYVNPFVIGVDVNKCVGCGLCVKSCPTMSLTLETVKAGGAGITCVKCGKCVDVCPKGAARFAVRGVDVERGGELSRILPLYAFYLFMAIFLGDTLAGGIRRLLTFLTTGSFI